MRSRGVRIGIISDTHGLLRPEALRALRDSALIVHAGDVGDPGVLDGLRATAPVVAVRGNNDRGAWARALRGIEIVDIAGARLFVVHDLKTLDRMPPNVDAIIAGHSHKPAVVEHDGILFVNPGSAGPRRFSLPVSVARMHAGRGRIDARIVDLRLSGVSR